MEREPKAFRMLRQRLEAAADTRAIEKDEEEEEGMAISDGELNFMPLELNACEYLNLFTVDLIAVIIVHVNVVVP